jgi:AcrR family transcriptional regulator
MEPPRLVPFGPVSTPEPLIRPPLQRRSQESLERVLQAGFDVLKEEGFEGFTLQAVSARAEVSIGSIYARVPSREALIMAIYERVMAWTEEDQISPSSARDRVSARVRIEMLVSELAGQMLTHGSDLRVFMRQAAVDPDIWQRGAEKSQATAEVFRRAVLEHPEDIAHRDPDLAVDVAFRMMYCTIARRITHGPQFESSRDISDDALVAEISRAIADYLL